MVSPNRYGLCAAQQIALHPRWPKAEFLELDRSAFDLYDSLRSRPPGG
jgi:hypothetical protein